MLNASKFLRTLAASALVAGTIATLVPAVPAFATSVAAATSFVPSTPASTDPRALKAGWQSAWVATWTPTTSVPVAGTITIVLPGGIAAPTTATFLANGGTNEPTLNSGASVLATNGGASTIILTVQPGAATGVAAQTITFPYGDGLINPAAGLATAATIVTSADATAPVAFPANTFTANVVGDEDQVVSVQAVPNTPSLPASYAIQAMTKSNLTAGVSTITLNLVEATNFGATGGYGLPTTFDKSQIVISGGTCLNGAIDAIGAAPTACGAGQTVSTQSPPANPTINQTTGTLTFTVPDMNPSGQGAAGHNLAAGIINIGISANAGITNPTAASATKRIWANDSTDLTAPTAALVNATAASNTNVTAWGNAPLLPRVLTINDLEDKRGAVVTVNGYGFSGATATVFLDNGGAGSGVANNGNQDGTEPTLATAAITGGAFTTTFTVSSTFLPVAAAALGTANPIQAIDASGPIASQTQCVPAAGNTGCGTRATASFFTLDPTLLSLSPTSGSVGNTVTAQLIDFPAADACKTGGAGITFGGIKISCAADVASTISASDHAGAGQAALAAGAADTLELTSAASYGINQYVKVGTEIELITTQPFVTVNGNDKITSVVRGQLGTTPAVHAVGAAVSFLNQALTSGNINADGTQTWTFNVPVGVKQGVATVVNTTVNATAGPSKTFTVNGAIITVTPSTVVPGQQITITGTNFTAGAFVVNSTGTAAGWNGVQVGGAYQGTGGGAGALVVAVPPNTQADNNGNIVMQFKLPTTAANGSQTSPGQYAVAVTDNSGNNVSGQANITVASPSLTISPTTGLGGSTITFSGGGFGASTNVLVTYPSIGGNNNTTANAQTDSNGNYSGTLVIPSAQYLGIPSNNTVTAVDQAAGLGSESASAVHAIPSAGITVAPTTGAPGQAITVTGVSFPTFTSVTSLCVGGNSVALNGVNTDASGNFTANAIVPGVTAGTVTIVANVGGNAGNNCAVNGGTTANASFVVTTQPSTVSATSALAALVNTQNLNIVTSFNYGTGLYQAYVPALAGNSLVNISPNSVLFITMTKDTTVIVSGISFSVKANVPTPLPVGAAVTVSVQ